MILLVWVSSAEGSTPKLQLGRSLDHCSQANKRLEVALYLGEVKKEDKLFEYEISMEYDTNVVYSPGVSYNNTLVEIWGEQNYTSGGSGFISSSGGTTGIVKAASGNKPLVNFSFLYRDGICTDAVFEIRDLYLGTDYVGPVETEQASEIRLDVKSIVKEAPERIARFGFDGDTLNLNDEKNTITLNLNIGEYKFLEWLSFEIESSNPDMFIMTYTHSDNVEINDEGLGDSLLKLEIDFTANEDIWIEFEIGNNEIENKTKNDIINYSQFEIKNVLFNECNCIKTIETEVFDTKLVTRPNPGNVFGGDQDNSFELFGNKLRATKNIRDIKCIDLQGRIVYEKEFLLKGQSLNLENKTRSVYFITYVTDKMEKKFKKIIIN